MEAVISNLEELNMLRSTAARRQVKNIYMMAVTADLGPVRLPFELRFLYHPVDTAPEERVAFPMTTGQPAYFAIYSDWAYQFWLMAGVQFSQGF